MPYSVDLRERVVAAIDSGTRATDAAKIFKVCRKIIYHWLNLRKQTNSLNPKTGYQKGHSHKITDWDKFKKFAETNRQCSSPQMAIKWKALTGTDVTDNIILKALKKIGYTSKKKHSVMPKQIK